MAQFSIILNQIGVFILLLAIGAVLRKTGILNEGSLFAVSQITIKVALPAFIFHSTVYSTTKEDYKNALPAIIVIIVVYIIIFILGFLITGIFRLKGNTNRIFRMSMAFGNVGLVGAPVAIELYPDSAMIYIAVVTVIDQILMWTYGMNLSFDVESGQKVRFDKKRIKEILLNPPLVAIAVSLVFVAFDLSLPAFMNNAMEKVGAMLSPLGMIYVGGMLAWPDIKYALKRPEIYTHIVVKMIILPTAVYLIMRNLGLPEGMCGTLSIIIGVPVFMAAMMLAKNNGSDYRTASGMVMLSTLAFMITYPVTSLLISLF